jgi:hypothetical protein
MGRYELELKVKVLAELKPQQIKRLAQLSLQFQQIIAVTDKRVADRVGLSPAQLKRAREIFQAGRQNLAKRQQGMYNEVASHYKGVNPKTDAEKKQVQQNFVRDMRAAQQRQAGALTAEAARNAAEIMSVLTPQQKSTWRSLLGRPFKFPG